MIFAICNTQKYSNHLDLSLAKIEKIFNHLDLSLAKVAKVSHFFYNHLDLPLANLGFTAIAAVGLELHSGVRCSQKSV